MSADSAPDRRRHPWLPVLVIVGVLLIAAVVVWFPVLRPSAENSLACNQPGPAPVTTAPTTRSQASSTDAPSSSDAPAPSSTATTTSVATTLGAYLDHSVLASVRPANPATIPLQVYNASPVRGQAKAVTDELRVAGFESIKDGANDPLYPASDLRCVAQIRFGPAGAAAARTVLLVSPCAQLVQDSRVDDSVDLSLGGRYLYSALSDEVKNELVSIRDAAQPPAVIEGQTASAKPLPSIPPLPTAACAS